MPPPQKNQQAPHGYSIRLPALPDADLSPNAFLSMSHWARAKARESQRDLWLGYLHQARAQWFGRILCGRVAVSIEVRGVGARTDVGNWVGHIGWKVLLDCLTEPRGRKNYGLGILKDDSSRYVGSVSVTVVPDGAPETVLRIECGENHLGSLQAEEIKP